MQKKTPWISRSKGPCIRLAHLDQLMRSDLHSWSLRQLVVDRREDRTDVGGSPLPRLHGLIIMFAVVLAQCGCCSRLLLLNPWRSRHLARLRFAGATQAGRPWATGKGLRCDGSRSMAAQWAQMLLREPAMKRPSAGSICNNGALTDRKKPSVSKRCFRVWRLSTIQSWSVDLALVRTDQVVS